MNTQSTVETGRTAESSNARTRIDRPRLAVILTCFNRKQKTLDSLSALAANVDLDLIELSVVLVDDGSTDGTAEAVNAAFPWVQVVVSVGNLYWCRGMHMAFDIALKAGHDYYLWLNDDTMLNLDAVSRLLQCESNLRKKLGQPVIVAGSTVDAETGDISYGGEVRAPGLRRSRFLRVIPGTVAQKCDSMTGNIVLIPDEIARVVGNVDASFEHAMGDTDYALRAGQHGFGIWVGPGVFGTCSDNSQSGTFNDADLPLARRWKQMMSRKGLPWRSWLVFTRRHMGVLWPLYFVWPYLKLVIGQYNRRVKS